MVLLLHVIVIVSQLFCQLKQDLCSDSNSTVVESAILALGMLESKESVPFLMEIFRSPKQNKLIQDVCLTQAVDLFKGQLVSRCGTHDELARCIVRVAQAVVGLARSSR